MGEKGNVTSEELAQLLAGGAAGGAAVVAASEGLAANVAVAVGDTAAQAVDTLRDKVIDKGADAAIAVGQEKMRRNAEAADGEGSGKRSLEEDPPAGPSA